MAYTPPPSTQITQLATSDYESMLAWIRMQEGIVADLEAEIERLKAPSTRGRIFGFTVENGAKTPSTAEYAKNKSAMDWGQRIGFNTYRIFLNPTEMRNMSGGASVGLENIITYGTSLGLAFMVDTMDAICKMLPLDSSLKMYCDGGAKLGWKGIYFNDADRLDLPIETLRLMVGRVRKYASVPIYGSLMGTADIALYKTIFDRVEIQTFGSDSELANYLKIDAIPCLDLRKPLTTEQLKAKAAIIVRNPPRDLFFYSDLNSDYADMPDSEDEVVRGLLQALKVG